jgi:hypothetical protein
MAILFNWLCVFAVGHDRYMAEKRRKLHVQYDSDSANKLLR